MSYDIGKSLVISGSTTALKTRFKTAYKQFDAVRFSDIKGGVNYSDNLSISFLDNATYPHGPTDTDATTSVPANYLFIGIENTSSIQAQPTSSVFEKPKYIFPVIHGRNYNPTTLSYGEIVKSNFGLPISFISGNLTDGYQSKVSSEFMTGVIITNIHNDTYGPSVETPVQGPFTNQWVGGRQSRHVSINRGVDDYTTRPEAWKIVFGTGSFTGSTYETAMGFIGADYPYPEGNPSSPSFPVLAHKRATYYREETAKRPVNIRNILTTTSSYEYGNYLKTYEVVATAGRTSNNRLMRQAINEGTYTASTELSGVVRTLGGAAIGRTNFTLPERSGSAAIVGSRFSAPGGARYSSRGFLNHYAEELSPYNALSFRNREILGSSHGKGLTNQAYLVSGAVGTGSIATLSKHSERFGFLSGSSTIPSAHSVNRNTTGYLKNAQFVSQYDNYYVSHQIPRKDSGYSWIADSLATSSNSGTWEYYAHADGKTYLDSNTLTSSMIGYKVDGSTISSSTSPYTVPQDFVGLNTIIVEPIDVSTNIIGTASISDLTSDFITNIPTASNLFNSMLAHRNGAFGLSTFKQLSHHRNDKISQYLKNNNLVQNLDTNKQIQTYSEPVIDNSNYPIIVETYIDQNQITSDSDLYDITFTFDNNNCSFSNIDLNRSVGKLNKISKETSELLSNSITPKRTEGFYYEPKRITYKKRIFPVSSAPQRKRTSFVHDYWRDEREDRTVTPYVFNNCTLYTSSAWPLDSRLNFETTQGTFSVSNRNNSSEGILQNLYTQRYDSDVPTSTPLYYYKQSVVPQTSVRAPSGIKNTDLPFPTAEITASALFANSTKWQVTDDTGYKPYDDSYDAWLDNLHKKKIDFSVLPEYRISSKIPTLIDNNFSISALDENYIEITGASLYASTSSNDIAGASYVEKLIGSNNDVYKTPKITLKLTCETVEKFLPYNGFYPVERTLDIVNAFSESYSNFVSIISNTTAIPPESTDFKQHYRTMISPLFAPGILYNTIKSGIAVDYPILTASLTTSSLKYTSSATDKYYQIGNNNFDLRLPFETILNPEKYLQGIRLIDMNPHPNVRLSNSTASLYGASDDNYKLMVNNFLAETVNMFLKNSVPSTIRSEPISVVKAESGMRYQALLKIYKTTSNTSKQVSTDSNSSYKDYPRPQYSDSAAENITMFSNPLGFGPPCGAGYWISGMNNYTSGTKDSGNGYNSPFTPPYYDGESWAIIEFAPNSSRTYTIDEIIGSSSVKYIRYEFDAFGGIYDSTNGNTQIQGSDNMNNNAMQISASLNLFNIVDIKDVSPLLNQNGGISGYTSDKTQTKKVWEISSKFETPILNFHPSATLNTVAQTSATASDYGLANAGMWLQYGVAPTSDQGVFMQISDVPYSYLKYGTYGEKGSITESGYYYNDNNGIDVNSIKSLVSLVGFSTQPTRMGELADSRIIKEAIVAIPYTISQNSERQFVKLDKQKVHNFLNGKESTLSQTVKEQITKLQDYILPLHLDFINNEDVQPISMYVFEVEKQLNQSDLSNIWQNVMPESLNKIENNVYSITHVIEDEELLNTLNVDKDKTIKFMCFKVKQRGITRYEFADYDSEQLPKASLSNKKMLKQQIKKLKNNPLNKPEKKELDKELIGYNWPYDYCSLVELAKIDATIEFSEFNKAISDSAESSINEFGDSILSNVSGTFSIPPVR